MTARKNGETSLRLALTGARGRLAPGLAAHLRRAGHHVALFSREAGGPHRDLADLAKPESLCSFDAVLHLGWSTVPLLSEENPGAEELRDFPFAAALAGASQLCPAPPLVVFFSTAAVYGDTGGEPATETTPCRPLGRYAAAKLRAEEIFAACGDACILRISNVFGGGCALTRPQGIIPVLWRAARDGAKTEIWGDGSALKDYLAVPDLHRAVESVLARRLRGIFNVSSGTSLTVNEIVSLVEQACGRKIDRDFLPHYPWDVSVSRVSSAKLQNASGWAPQIDPHDYLRSLPE